MQVKKVLLKYNGSTIYCYTIYELYAMSAVQRNPSANCFYIIGLCFYVRIYVYNIPSSFHCTSCSDLSSGVCLLPENFQYSEKYIEEGKELHCRP